MTPRTFSNIKMYGQLVALQRLEDLLDLHGKITREDIQHLRHEFFREVDERADREIPPR